MAVFDDDGRDSHGVCWDICGKISFYAPSGPAKAPRKRGKFPRKALNLPAPKARIKNDFAGNSAAKMSNSPASLIEEFMKDRYTSKTIPDSIAKWINTRTFADGVILTFRDLKLDKGIYRLIVKDGELFVRSPSGFNMDAALYGKLIDDAITATSSKFSPDIQPKCDRALKKLLFITRVFPYMINRILNATPYTIDNVGLSNYKWEGEGAWEYRGYVSIVHKDRELSVDDTGCVREIYQHRVIRHDYLSKNLPLRIIVEKYNLNNFKFSAKVLKKYGDIALIAAN